jgi:hypothetical protein
VPASLPWSRTESEHWLDDGLVAGGSIDRSDLQYGPAAITQPRQLNDYIDGAENLASHARRWHVDVGHQRHRLQSPPQVTRGVGMGNLAIEDFSPRQARGLRMGFFSRWGIERLQRR